MEPPDQNNIVIYNMIDLFYEFKPIKRLRVLAISEKISSWNYDAKTCARIYSRMIKYNYTPPSLMPLMSKWAEYLLEYAEAFEIGTQGMLLDGTAKWQANSIWLVNLLKTIKETDSVEKLYKYPVEFNVKSFWKNRPPRKIQFCSILDIAPSFLFIYYLKTDSGEIISESAPVGGNTTRYLKKHIHEGLKRHRSLKKREKLKNQIKEKKRANQLARGHRDRIFR